MILYPYEEPVGIILNENGIALNLPLNRIIEGYGVIRGTFFVCGLTEDDFCGLTDDQIKRYSKQSGISSTSFLHLTE